MADITGGGLDGIGGGSGELPIPAQIPLDGQALNDLRRLRHRRKRYSLFLLRNNRRKVSLRVQGLQRAFFLTLGSIVGVILALIGATGVYAVSYYQSELPSIEALQQHVLQNDSLRIYDMHGTLLYEFQDLGTKRSIDYNQIPGVVRNATIAIEDQYFWTNIGIDPQRIIGAAIHNQSSDTVQGGSTITQQLIKNYVFNPDPTQYYVADPTLNRKIHEVILATGMTLTHQYTKSQILTMYLNLIPYGPDTYGIDAAAHAYFGYTDDPTTGRVAAEQLTLSQASFLSGIPENPNLYNPLTPAGFVNTLARQQLVLNAMVNQHYITKAQAAQATKDAHSLNFLNLPATTANLAPHFVEYVRQQLLQMVDTGQLDLSRSGLAVYTTLDLNLQNQVQAEMKDHLFGNDRDDYGGYVRNDNASDAAAVLMDQKSGDIRVLLGSWDANATKTPFGKPVDGSFDVATEGYRQAGSTFKPLIYLTSFEKGWFPAMTISDSPTVFPDSSHPYKPLDFDRGIFAGTVTIRNALQKSLDIPAVKAMNFDGVQNISCFPGGTNCDGVTSSTMARLGFAGFTGTPGLAAGIGSLGVRPIDMVHAYATFANYGLNIPPNAIDHIVDADGNTIFQYAPPRGTQVFSPEATYLLTSVLTDNQSRSSAFGICSPLRLFTSSQAQCQAGNPGVEYPVASKTGTTDGPYDDWAMGYTMDYTGGIWVGNDNESDSMYHIDGITGAAPIWYHMMLDAENGKPPTQFPVPAGVARATYSSNGVTSTDWFLANNVPTVQGTGEGTPVLCIANINANNANDPWDYCGPGSPSKQATPTP